MLEFFAKDGKRRVNIDHEGPPEPSADTNSKPPEALLLTPETGAHVLDPGTEFAFAEYLSAKPEASFERQFNGLWWGCMSASYSLLDRLAKGLCVLESVERDPENAGWYHVRVRIGSKGQLPMDVWLDEAADFVVRKTSTTLSSGAGEMLSEIGPYVSVGDGGWLPKKYVKTAYAVESAPSGAAGETRRVVQRTEFELLGGVETSDIPDSCFTLESLGVSDPRDFTKLWLLVAAAAAALVIVVVLSRRRRRVHQAASGAASAAPQ
ncbi:MAG: hypothetical protein ACRESR_01220, partial [Gammaproteobacteria bacterium]